MGEHPGMGVQFTHMSEEQALRIQEIMATAESRQSMRNSSPVVQNNSTAPGVAKPAAAASPARVRSLRRPRVRRRQPQNGAAAAQAGDERREPAASGTKRSIVGGASPARRKIRACIRQHRCSSAALRPGRTQGRRAARGQSRSDRGQDPRALDRRAPPARAVRVRGRDRALSRACCGSTPSTPKPAEGSRDASARARAQQRALRARVRQASPVERYALSRTNTRAGSEIGTV